MSNEYELPREPIIHHKDAYDSLTVVANAFHDMGRAATGMSSIIDRSKCLHCGESEPSYCEHCYQDLVAKNIKLQRLATHYLSELKLIAFSDQPYISSKNANDTAIINGIKLILNEMEEAINYESND